MIWIETCGIVADKTAGRHFENLPALDAPHHLEISKRGTTESTKGTKKAAGLEEDARKMRLQDEDWVDFILLSVTFFPTFRLRRTKTEEITEH